MPSMDDDDGWGNVKEWLEQLMAETGTSKASVVRGAGVDQRTLDKLLDGVGVKRTDRLAVLARFFGFRGDAFDRVRHGEPPVRVEGDDEAELRFRSLERRVDRLEALLEGAVRPPGPGSTP